MKSDKAEDYLINHECGYPMDGYVPLMEAGRAVEIAEQEAEESIQEKAYKIILDMMAGIFHGDMPRKIAYEFIQKLTGDEKE